MEFAEKDSAAGMLSAETSGNRKMEVSPAVVFAECLRDNGKTPAECEAEHAAELARIGGVICDW